MNPRQRVLSAIQRQEVFPVPVDLFENGVYPLLEADLTRHFGLARGDIEGVLQALGSCVRWARPVYAGPDLQVIPELPVSYPMLKAVKNIWGTWDGPETYTDAMPRPLARAESIADIDAHAWPDPSWFDYTRVGVPYLQPNERVRIVDWAEQNRDYARIAMGWNPIASRVLDLFGMEQGLINMAVRPDLVEAALVHIGEFMEEYYERCAAQAEGYFDILSFGDDFASQQGLLMSAPMWRRYFLPLWRRLFAIAHAHGMRAMMHSCGAIRRILGDLVDAGLDILEVVQVTAVGMDPSELKREFGHHLSFYGGIDVQYLMPNGSPEDVRREARRLIGILGKGGGYVLATMHFMMDDVPAENVLALYDEARHYVPD